MSDLIYQEFRVEDKSGQLGNLPLVQGFVLQGFALPNSMFRLASVQGFALPVPSLALVALAKRARTKKHVYHIISVSYTHLTLPTSDLV